MRNPRAALMLVAALASAFGATLLAARWLDRKASAPVARIALAANDLPVGHRIAGGDIRMTDWPGTHRPAGAFANAAELEGRVIKSNLLRNEPFLEPKLAPRGSKGGLSAVISEGRRAMTVRVNDVVGVAGFALPGNYVDVMVSTRDDRDAGSGSGSESMISKIVLERILVLAVAQEASRDDTKPRVVNAVTLEVTPLDAERLDLARSVGQLSLVLRNQVDPSPVQTSGVTKDRLLFGAEGTRPRPAVAPQGAGGRPPAPPGTTPSAAPRSAQLPAVAIAPRQCIDALVGHERQSECF